MISEEIKPQAVNLSRQTLYANDVNRTISLTKDAEPTAYTFTFNSSYRILLATVNRAWPMSNWAGAMVTVNDISYSNNTVTVKLSTNSTQNYSVSVRALYYIV